MIRVYYANGALYIDGIDLPIVAGTLSAAMVGDQVQITADSRSYPLTSIPWAQVADMGGNGFGSPGAVMVYLQGEFGRPIDPAITVGPGAPDPSSDALVHIDENSGDLYSRG